MKSKAYLFLASLVIVTLACGTASGTATEPVVVEADAPATSEAAAEPTIEPTATVEHTVVPGEFPEEPSGVVGDQDSSVTAEDNRAPGGDRFTFTRFERPFNAQAMDEYYPYLDILEGTIYVDDVWIYVSIVTKNDESSRELSGRYGIEIDFDIDGDGEWLVLASNPVSNEWTTAGVSAWFDANDDVGGESPSITDEHSAVSDGFESQEFGDGIGADPDMAWVRVSAEEPNVVQLAIKTDVLKGSERFLAGLWAGEENLDPALFDLSDHFTHEQAGAALIELDIFYPIKEISALDNTCRMAIGFQPTGSEPGLCPLPGQAAGEEQVEEGCNPQYLVCREPLTYVGPAICTCNEP
ncbi:MAG: hypothetical protein IPG44_13345 [Anaerolineales bacterium]|jgi:hypothetical protein|nr:hypothetical protein [Anaerolineales bacterium]